MKTKREFVSFIAEITAELDALEWNDPKRFFTPTLETMARDSKRWIENEWASPAGTTTPIERAIVILTQDLIVLLGHAGNAGIKHERLTELALGAVEAANTGAIEDSSHFDYFTHPESPLHELIAI
jgi:hypothetical protein